MVAIFVLRSKAAIEYCHGHRHCDDILWRLCQKAQSRLLFKFSPKGCLQPFRQPIDNKSEIFKSLTKTHFYNINNNNK
jgi:hypothetical protein